MIYLKALIAFFVFSAVVFLAHSLIVQYGSAQNKLGAADCRSEQYLSQVISNADAQKTKSRIDIETEKLSDLELNDSLFKLGILRDNKDR